MDIDRLQPKETTWWTRHCASIAILATLGLSLAADGAAQTRVYRCTMPNGEIEFSQRPCAAGASEQELDVEDRRTGWTPPQPTAEPAAKPKRKSGSGKKPGSPSRKSAEARREERCWKKRQLLDEVTWKLRRGYKAGKGVALRRKRRSYEDYIDRFCK